MNGRQSGLSGAPAGSLFNLICPAARGDGCSLRRATLDAGSRYGLKESLTECETDVFLSLALGHRIAVRDPETGALWTGRVDMTFPENGFVWVTTDVGERKLLDIGVHTIWAALNFCTNCYCSPWIATGKTQDPLEAKERLSQAVASFMTARPAAVDRLILLKDITVQQRWCNRERDNPVWLAAGR
ncbi:MULTISPECIES: hypothetical protein [unclassified Arthrobacter]|jgi:hypothetical protein|uniref:hypothetical protein n=1 Tax=unclassified Arthrobacter TaxID=235627 RepID=UPI0009CC92D1|nr:MULTISPECIES: hypothetical protein [unclassified Arthrobacter]SLK15368.1 hypothetical protein SAMN06272721_12430 [Arthrobacter sp. P2b]